MPDLRLGDCVEVMRSMDEASVDAIVCDPPYELGFMGKAWDKAGVAFDPATWREALRVLKPGGHLLAFGGTRTFHRLTCAIEDAGFEIRDCLMWLYGSGFPKSLDVSKAIDKAAGAEREVVGPSARHAGTSKPDAPIGDLARFAGAGSVITAPSTDAAREWQGWGTALKPAYEPIVMARKPLISTVAVNVQAHGTGALNVDGCRIETSDEPQPFGSPRKSRGGLMNGTSEPREQYQAHSAGRWPANVLLDEEAARMLDEQTGALGFSGGTEVAGEAHPNGIYGSRQKEGRGQIGYGDTGGASRFFYCAKASRRERWGVVVCACNGGERWAKRDPEQDEAMDATSRQRDTCEDATKGGCDSSTTPCGNPREAQSHPDTKSITETGLRPTTESRTSASSPQLSTSDSMAGANSETERGGSPAARAGSSSPSAKSTSTSPVRGGRYTGVVGPVTSVRSLTTSACDVCGEAYRVESHPTQKPESVMRWLVRLVTPPGGVVLDPFMGSGTTGIAAREEGFHFIGIEKDASYLAVALDRLDSKEDGNAAS